MRIRWIKGLEGRYAVTDDGQVASYLGREPKWLSATLNSNGYPHVQIGPEGNRKTHTVHRLVASHFIEIPASIRVRNAGGQKTEVNHLDGNKRNNRWTNLEWTTPSGNMKHAHARGLSTVPPRSWRSGNPMRRVRGIHRDTGEILEFSSTSQAALAGFHRGNVSDACHGRRPHHHGFLWEYIDERGYHRHPDGTIAWSDLSDGPPSSTNADNATD